MWPYFTIPKADGNRQTVWKFPGRYVLFIPNAYPVMAIAPSSQ